MGGTTTIERGEAGEPARVITRDSGEGGTSLRQKDPSRLPNQPLSIDTPSTIHNLRITRDEALTGFRWICVGDGAEKGLAFVREVDRNTLEPDEFCEVVSQETARRGLHDRIYDELLPGQAAAIRAAIVEAAIDNRLSYRVGNKQGSMTCPIAFDAGYMLTHQSPERSVVRFPQPNGAPAYELDVATVPEEQIAQAQRDCYASPNASTAGGLVAGMARGLEFGLEVSSAPAGATPLRRTAHAASR